MSVISDRFKKFVRRTWEKFTGSWNEGPEPPDRLADMAVYFANVNPHATRLDWVRFATEHAREAYKSGFLRGFENSERDPEDSEVDPDILADAYDSNWRWNPANLEGEFWYDPRQPQHQGGIMLEDGEHVVPELYDEDEVQRAMLLREFGVK